MVVTETLAQLRRHARAIVVGFVEDDEESVRKLLAIGVVPGDHLVVLATFPACLFELGSASYAVDRELASKILVKLETP